MEKRINYYLQFDQTGIHAMAFDANSRLPSGINPTFHVFSMLPYLEGESIEEREKTTERMREIIKKHYGADDSQIEQYYSGQ